MHAAVEDLNLSRSFWVKFSNVPSSPPYRASDVSSVWAERWAMAALSSPASAGYCLLYLCPSELDLRVQK